MTADDRIEVQQIVLLLSIGICEALKREAVSLEDAEHMLFSPAMMQTLRELGFPETLVGIILAARSWRMCRVWFQRV